MKKAIILGLMMLSTSIIQAATIAWGNTSSSQLVGVDGSTSITSVNAGSYSLVVQLINFTDGSVVDQTLSGSTAINSMTAGVLSGATLNYTYNSVPAHGINSGDQYYVHLTATMGGQDYYMNVFNNNTANNYWAITAINDSGTDIFSWSAATYGGTGIAGDAGKWIAVPEPTSLALLAIGGGLVGLRRRFRKS